MAKKRRTKKAKIAAVEKKGNFDFVFDIPQEARVVTKQPVQEIRQEENNYSYVPVESKNSILITVLLIAVNIMLFIALKQNYINLFGIEF